MAFSVVQSAKKSVNGLVNDGAQTLAFGSNVTAGNFIAVFISVYVGNQWNSDGWTSILSDGAVPTDTLGHVYAGFDAAVKYNTGTTNAEHLRAFYVANISGGANTVTFHFDHNITGAALTVVIAELSGIATSTPLDKFSSNFSNTAGTTADSGSQTTTTADQVILGMASSASGANPATFTELDSATQILEELNGVTNQVVSTSYLVQSATGSRRAAWTIDSNRWGAQMATFKLAAGTPASMPPSLIVRQAVKRAAYW